MDELTAPEFFSLATRTFAYQGVMAARWEAEQHETQPRPPQRQERQHRTEPEGAQVVNLDQFRVMFPGLVSHRAKGGD